MNDRPDPREYRDDICIVCNNVSDNLTLDDVCPTCNSLYGPRADDIGRDYDDYIRRYLEVSKEN